MFKFAQSLVIIILFLSLNSQINGTGKAEQRSKGLEKKYRALLAQSRLISIKDQAEHTQKINKALELWRQQLAEADKELPREEFPEIEEIKKDSKTSWIQDYPILKKNYWRWIPKTEEWDPKWGLSLKQRRSSLTESEASNIKHFKILKEESRQNNRRAFIYKAHEYKPTQREALLTVHSPKMFINTRTLYIAPPKAFAQENWQLWYKFSKQKEWKKTNIKGYGMIPVTYLSPRAGELFLIFTPEGLVPGSQKANFHFLIDNKPPIIKTFELASDGGSYPYLIWNIKEDYPLDKFVTISIISNNDTVFATTSGLEYQGQYIINKDIAEKAKEAHISVVDKAGNISEKTIPLFSH